MTSAGQLLARLGKFNLVGLLGAALQLLLLYLLTKCFHMSAVAATPVAVEIVVLHNFAWHERFTWRDRPLNRIRQRMARLWRFHAGNGLTSLLGNTALVYALVEWIHAPIVLSAIVAIVVCSLVNFFLADRWVYAGSKDEAAARPPSTAFFPSQNFVNTDDGPFSGDCSIHNSERFGTVPHPVNAYSEGKERLSRHLARPIF